MIKTFVLESVYNISIISNWLFLWEYYVKANPLLSNVELSSMFMIFMDLVLQ